MAEAPAPAAAAEGGDIQTLFVTQLYQARLPRGPAGRLNQALAASAQAIAAEDEAGQGWSAENGYQGYTSYASLNDLAWRDPAFAELTALIAPHAAAFAKALDYDLGGRRLAVDSLWINILNPGGAHTGHIHPHSVLSGTYYVAVPPGSGALKLEDPRLAMMMAAPPRRARARAHNRNFIYVEPKPGLLLLWESWLRHEVAPNRAAEPRISVSFNLSLA